MVDRCPLELNGIFIWENLNILRLELCDILIGMIWLEAHKVKFDCHNKNFDCIDEDGNLRIVRGIPKDFLIRNILSLQLKKCFRKKH